MKTYGKEIQFADKKIKFKFIGNPKKNINKNNINNVINNLFTNKSVNEYYGDLTQLVIDIKKTFIDFTEKELDIEILQNNNVHNSIKIINKKVVDYFYQKDIDDKLFEIRYSNENGINYNVSNYSLDKVKKILQKVEQNINDIDNMQIKPYSIYQEELIIMNMYKLFYGKNIDFSSKYTYEEICIMMAILSRYDIRIKNMSFDIAYAGICEKIYSPEVDEMIDRLKFYGEINPVNSIELYDNVEKIIKKISNELQELIVGQDYEKLTKIGICTMGTHYGQNFDYIIDCTKVGKIYSKDQVTESFQYVKKFDDIYGSTK